MKAADNVLFSDQTVNVFVWDSWCSRMFSLYISRNFYVDESWMLQIKNLSLMLVLTYAGMG